MLVEDYLYAVVSLPAGVFNPYSGVKTSILLMDKALARQRKEILFVKIDNDGYNLGAQRTAVKGSQLEEAIALIHSFSHPVLVSGSVNEMLKQVQHNSFIAHAVLRTEIAANGDYSLSGERYKKQIQLQTDFPTIDFEESIEKVVYSNKIKSSDYKSSGRYPIIDQSDNYIAGYWDKEQDVFKINKPVTIFGDHTRCFKYVDFDFVLGADGVKILQPIEKFDPKFYYYLIREIQINNLGYSRHYKELKDKKLPLPLISIQQEIVAEIEGYQKIIDGAKAVIAHYKPKIEINPDWELVELGEVCEKFQYGSSKKSLSSGEVVCLRMGNIQNGEIEWSDLKFAPRDEDFEKYLLEPGDVLFNRTNSPVHVGKTGIYRGERKSVFAGYLIRLKYRKDVILGDYLNYCLNTNKAKEFCQRVKTDGINQSNINAKVLATFQIPLPKIETQRQIVAQIEKEQALVNANKQLIEIFEQKIKDRIAKVWGVEKTEEATLSRAAEPATEYLKN
jgi:type I restriction enzyme M protein